MSIGAVALLVTLVAAAVFALLGLVHAGRRISPFPELPAG
ncbi:hypothetical protein XM38_050910 [Halomicronema hongdechloris C2206]|uniref:Uncharacterized protein n=1 Tax=Halomicronema hongdechloris C2206 TaxID=1641165 RepID=A0A1Z3HV10_9CYAN|nr:hypothetical protein XM38_050910 [Halomicronema hongdechloris C2206]